METTLDPNDLTFTMATLIQIVFFVGGFVIQYMLIKNSIGANKIRIENTEREIRELKERMRDLDNKKADALNQFRLEVDSKLNNLDQKINQLLTQK